ncbi:helix-turn-helix domain-containing protein [Algicola sagamiensis]|uniref:helix-turn-helix domain-containing protein n=1 Tax=Algicola sagamiensis TaxID=163869 RepID=UPI0003803FC4|nr:helix-turn-helix domain-containing protein [Algicola sagamiensis]
MSEIIKSLREDLSTLCDENLIPKVTLREFDQAHMSQITAMSSDEVKALRLKLNISQAVLAKYMNMSPESIQKWERGETKPSGAALRLLNVIQKHGFSVF